MGQVVRLQDPGNAVIRLIQSEFPQYHPALAIARLAHKKEVIADPRLEFDCHKALLPYVNAKLASIEVKSSMDDDRTVIVSLFEQSTLEDGRVVETEIPLVTEVAELVPLDS